MQRLSLAAGITMIATRGHDPARPHRSEVSMPHFLKDGRVDVKFEVERLEPMEEGHA